MPFQQVKRKIYVVLDTTGSMGGSYEATSKAIQMLLTILEIIGMQLVVVVYGDYTTKYDTIDDVTTILNAMTIKTYRLCQNGGGGDCPEAVASAFYKLTNETETGNVMMITDAPPHSSPQGGDNIIQARTEKLNLLRVKWPYQWDAVCQKITTEFSFKINILCTAGDYTRVYEPLGTVDVVPQLTTPVVLEKLLRWVNKCIEEDCSLANLDAIKEIDFLTGFRQFALDNPVCLEYLCFLSNHYYKLVKKLGRHETEEHGRFVDKLIRTGLVSKPILDMFKDAQAQGISLEMIQLEFPSKIYVIFNKPSLPFGILKDALACNMTSDVIKSLKENFQNANFVLSDSPNERAMPLEAIKDDPTRFASLVTLDDSNEFAEFAKGILPVLTSCIMQWITIPEIKMIFLEIATSRKFLPWLIPQSTDTVPETVWNRIKLQFLMQGVSKLYNCDLSPEASDLVKLRMYAFDRLISMVEILSMKNNALPVTTRVCLNNMSPPDAVKATNTVSIFYDVLLNNWYVSTIAFKKSHQEMIEIVKQMRLHNTFYNKTEEHFQKVLRLSEELGELIVSIYSINCHVVDNNEFNQADGRYYGYQDRFAKKSFLDASFHEKNPIPDEYDDLKSFYLSRIGVNGENLFQSMNMVMTSQILEGGPQMACCGKKKETGVCRNCYFRQDSSALDQVENTRCGSCRHGVTHFPMHSNTCRKCHNSFVSGIETPTGISPEACPFCLIPETVKEIPSVSLFKIFSDNIELFADHFGIPLEIFQKMVAQRSMAKIFRDTPDVPETIKPLPEIIFHEHGWDKKPLNEESILLYSGETILKDSVTQLLELIGSHFLIECGICAETVQYKNTKQFCQNKRCIYRFCSDCITNHTSSIRPGERVQLGQLQCPCCRFPIKKGLFKGTVPSVIQLYVGQKGQTAYDKILTDGLKIRMCSNVGSEDSCASETFSFEIDDRGLGCGALMAEAEEADAEGGVHQCAACLSREVERQKPRESENLLEGLGELMESGHYRADGDNGTSVYVRPCPKCHKVIELRSGCFHITCQQYHFAGEPPCDAHFCWCCGKLFEFHDGWDVHPCYQHLSDECTMVETVTAYQYHEDDDEDD